MKPSALNTRARLIEVNRARMGVKKPPASVAEAALRNLPGSIDSKMDRILASLESSSAGKPRRMGEGAGESIIKLLKAERTPAGAKHPDPERAAKGLSLTALYRKQPGYIKASGMDVVVRSYKKTKTKGGLPAIVGSTRDLNTKPVRPHKFDVIGLEKGVDISKQKRVKVGCDCEFFLYYSEFALWTWGAANIRYSNGDPAVVRNPGNFPLCCKHLAQVLTVIKERGD